MKKQYTEMITCVRKIHKRTGRPYDELETLGERFCEQLPSDQRALRRAVFGMELKYETGTDVCHIFMPDRSFCDWISECAKTMDAELGATAIQGFGSAFICLHFPCDSGLPGALVYMKVENNVGNVVLDLSFDSPIGGCCINTWLYGQSAQTEMVCKYDNADDTTPIDVRQKQADIGEYYTRMIAGLGLYMTCFPEQVQDGIPADAKRAEYAAGHAKTIGISESVVQRDGVTPHYRSGHFRLLSAERYVNKRGQVVFIRGCFVHGQAKTVLSPEVAEA